MEAEDAGLHGHEAAQAPGGEDHTMDEELFGLTGRLVGLEEAGLEDAKGFGIFVGQERASHWPTPTSPATGASMPTSPKS
jgi:hypothetical protein